MFGGSHTFAHVAYMQYSYYSLVVAVLTVGFGILWYTAHLLCILRALLNSSCSCNLKAVSFIQQVASWCYLVGSLVCQIEAFRQVFDLTDDNFLHLICQDFSHHLYISVNVLTWTLICSLFISFVVCAMILLPIWFPIYFIVISMSLLLCVYCSNYKRSTAIECTIWHKQTAVSEMQKPKVVIISKIQIKQESA